MVLSSVDMNSGCVFCNVAKERIISECDMCFAIFDAYPVSRGHVLIIPKRHVSDYFDLTADEVMAMRNMMTDIKIMLDREYSPDGYNVGVNVNEAAGQTVFHVHIHLIPRYNGDVEDPRGGIRGVIPGKQRY